jgi:DNA-binding CsgD family transcriptional regulator
MSAEIIDQIYESSLVPQQWQRTLEAIGDFIDAVGGVLVTGELNPDHWVASRSAAESMARIVRDDALRKGSLPRRVLEGHRQPRFFADQEHFSIEEFAEEPLIRDYFLPIGMFWGASTSFFLPTGESILVGWRRATEAGPFSPEALQKLDALRPHLGRAALIAARLRRESALAAAAALAALRLPALVLDHRGKILAANHLIEALPELLRFEALDRFSFAHNATQNLYRAASATIGHEGAPAVRSFAVFDRHGGPARVAHLVPIRLAAQDLFPRGAALLVLTPLTLPTAPPVELLQSLFDLTPAETRVARGLADGKRITELALTGGVAISTVRSQLRAVLDKTGCKRQTDVVALLTGISWLRL